MGSKAAEPPGVTWPCLSPPGHHGAMPAGRPLLLLLGLLSPGFPKRNICVCVCVGVYIFSYIYLLSVYSGTSWKFSSRIPHCSNPAPVSEELGGEGNASR